MCLLGLFPPLRTSSAQMVATRGETIVLADPRLPAKQSSQRSFAELSHIITRKIHRVLTALNRIAINIRSILLQHALMTNETCHRPHKCSLAAFGTPGHNTHTYSDVFSRRRRCQYGCLRCSRQPTHSLHIVLPGFAPGCYCRGAARKQLDARRAAASGRSVITDSLPPPDRWLGGGRYGGQSNIGLKMMERPLTSAAGNGPSTPLHPTSLESPGQIACG